jgi:phosphatidylserine/phosphatidylglycerophosphate/cardiolipin synthase-like enzyme
MSRRMITVFLPCDTFEVEALIGPSDVASPIERLAIRLVGEGIENLRDLDGLIGLGPRPTLDLVFGLWRRGHLSLNPATGRITVTAAVRQAIGKDQLDTLAGGELSTVRITLMQDLVSGTVVAGDATPYAPSPYRIVPPLLSAGAYRRTSSTSFQIPLERMVRRMSRLSGNRELKVFQSSLSLAAAPGEASSGARGFLRVEVACSRDPDSGRLAARVVFPAWLPLSAQSSISAGLTKVAERYPQHPAVQKLWEGAETETGPPPTRPGALADLLLGTAANLNSVPDDERLDRHTDLVTLSEVAAGLLGSEADATQRLVPLVGAREIDDAVARVICAASRQLVLACPWIRPQAFQRWHRLLRAQLAARPDLRVFLLWGISPDSSLPPDGPLVEWLEELRRSGRVLISPRSSNTHAKIAVADATQAVVASFNYMSSSPGERLEVGLEASATTPNQLPSPIALDLLRAALDLCPEHAMALELMTEPGQWGLPHPTESGASIVLPSFPDDEAEGEENEEEGAWTQRARWRLWAREWQGRARELANALHEHARPASIIRDGEHQQALWNELREAERRLVITSDQATNDVVTARFLDAFLSRGPGRCAALVYGRVPDALHATVAARCTPASGAVALRREASGGSHAKVLVADDRAVVTSYNFLSFDGDYEGDGRYEMRTELGVFLRDREVVAELTRKLTQALPDLGPVLANGTTAAASPPPGGDMRIHLSADDGARLHDLLSALRQAPGGAERREVLRIWVLGGRPWSGLRFLAELDFVDLPMVVALALLEHEDEADEEWQHWLLWWAERAWHGERTPIRAVVALSRLKCSAWSSRLPPASVAHLQWEIMVDSPAASAFDELVLDTAGTLAAGPASGLLALGLQLMIRGVAVEDACAMVAGRARPPLGAWLKHLSHFRDVGWQRPVPLDTVRARASSQEQHRDSEKARADALKAVEEAGRPGLWDFVKGRETRPFLFDEGQPFEQLQRALGDSAVQATRSWIRDHRDLEQLLDNATGEGLAALRPELAGELITEPRRTACLRRLRSPVVAVKAWLATNPQQPLSSEDLWAPTLELARNLRSDANEFAQLVSAAAKDRAAEAPILVALAQAVEPLLKLEM